MIPGGYAVVRSKGGFLDWHYAFAVAQAAAAETGRRHRVYRAASRLGYGLLWRVGPAIIR